MEIALLGAQASALRTHLTVPVVALSGVGEAAERCWALLALCDSPSVQIADALCCDTLLLQGRSDPAADFFLKFPFVLAFERTIC